MRHMKTIRTLALVALVVACTHTTALAQDWFGIATWNVSVPDGDTKNFVDETSFLGFGLEFRKEFRPKTTVGILGSWEVFHERRDGSIDIGSGTITGTNDRYINSFPIMLGLLGILAALVVRLIRWSRRRTAPAGPWTPA